MENTQKSPETGSDSEVLFPDREITIGDETIAVREFSYGEQLRYAARCRGLLAAIEQAFAADEAASVDDVIEDFSDEWLSLLALATGKPRDWLVALTREQGDLLSTAMWGANRDFFLRTIARRRVLRERMQSA